MSKKHWGYLKRRPIDKAFKLGSLEVQPSGMSSRGSGEKARRAPNTDRSNTEQKYRMYSVEGQAKKEQAGRIVGAPV